MVRPASRCKRYHVETEITALIGGVGGLKPLGAAHDAGGVDRRQSLIAGHLAAGALLDLDKDDAAALFRDDIDFADRVL